MGIFKAIINYDIEEVQRLIENKLATPNDLKPDSFIDQDGNVTPKRKREDQQFLKLKTLLELAEFLNREEIVKYLKSVK
jgi:hypothetical protein